MKMKIYARALLCVLLALIICAGSAMAVSEAFVGQITVNGALMSNRSFDALIDTLSKGTRVLYWDAGMENLVKAVTQDGKVGYIYEGYVKKVAQVKAGDVAKTTAGDVFSYRNKKMNKCATIAANQPLIVVATKGEWAKVKNLKGQTAYMKIADLKKAF